MKWSAAVFTDVPPAVVTVTSTVPEPFGEVTWISLADTILSMWTAVERKWTAVAPGEVRAGDGHHGATAGRARGRRELRDDRGRDVAEVVGGSLHRRPAGGLSMNRAAHA